MMRRAAFVLLGILLLPWSRGVAQSEGAAEATRLTVDAFLGVGYGNLVGGVSEGGATGPGAVGLGLEFHRGRPGVLRLEAFVLGAIADLGRTGMFDEPTTLTVNHTGLGIGYRRYSASRSYVGVGATIAQVTLCDVDTDGGPGFLGGQTVSCGAFAEIPLRKRSTVLGVTAGAGRRVGRFGLGLRVDAGLLPTVESDAGDMRVVNVGAQLQYHFGRR